ncbi:hypothetical protein R6Q59_031411 [Mikania micrantha]
MLTAKHGHDDIVKTLLDDGAPWNALSPSDLSAGDFAMDSVHQRPFDMLLNTGIQAELILGTIARKENKIGNLDGDYLEDRVSFSEDKLMDADSKAVMMAWEKPLMEAHAKAICSRGGHILNIGFGMGLVDTAIQQYGPVTHTIVEAHPAVYDRMRASGWTQKDNLKVVFGRWQDVLPQLEAYDGIFFDTYGEYYDDLREFHHHLPALLKPGGIYSFFNGLCGGCSLVVLSESQDFKDHEQGRWSVDWSERQWERKTMAMGGGRWRRSSRVKVDGRIESEDGMSCKRAHELI